MNECEQTALSKREAARSLFLVRTEQSFSEQWYVIREHGHFNRWILSLHVHSVQKGFDGPRRFLIEENEVDFGLQRLSAFGPSGTETVL